jgi:hypothetical protein
VAGRAIGVGDQRGVQGDAGGPVEEAASRGGNNEHADSFADGGGSGAARRGVLGGRAGLVKSYRHLADDFGSIYFTCEITLSRAIVDGGLGMFFYLADFCPGISISGDVWVEESSPCARQP